jgi:hypothetical protein
VARPRGTIGSTLALLLIAGALVSVSGCARREAQFGEAPESVAATGSAAASITATGQAAAADITTPKPAAVATSGAAAAGGSASGLSSQDASTLDAELSAIQSELDRLSVPSDSDFDNIGAGLK